MHVKAKFLLALYVVANFNPFNLICNTTISGESLSLTWSDVKGVCKDKMCLYGVLHSIPFNLICNMTSFRKKMY